MEYLTPPEIAKLFGVSPETVRRLIERGELPSIRFSEDGWHRVSREDVMGYAERKGIKLDWAVLQK